MHRLLTILLVGGLLWSQSALATNQPVISIIIDDMGYQLKAGQQAIGLPGKLTYAFLPYSPYARQLAEHAYREHKEVMLHLPMQADNGKQLGPGALTINQDEQSFKQTLYDSLASIPHVRGFNNHMGSYLTRNRNRMRWLMQGAMFHSDLYFVDSRTTAETVAEDEALRHGIATARRDIFLDYENNAAIVEQQLEKLVQQARHKGTAVAIGHPYPQTLTALGKWLPTLSQRGIKLVHVSTLIHLRQPKSIPKWQLSSYPSPRDVKNLKP
jgi:polysaccharide deacetylase 2 family uncharacterized protein YibQ